MRCALPAVGVLLLACILAGSTRERTTSRSNPGSATASAPAQPIRSDVAALIRQRVDATADARDSGHLGAGATELAALYAPGGYSPLWVDGTGTPGLNVHDGLHVLVSASTDGLDPAAYAVAHLRTLAATLEHPDTDPPSSAAMASFDVAMSKAVLRYFRHIHVGRVDPTAIGFRVVVPPERHDFAELLGAALAANRIRETATDLAPPLAQYRALRAALAHYRGLAAETELDPLPGFNAIWRPGEHHKGLDALHRRLVALGDLPDTVAIPVRGTLYDGPFVDAVKRFQARHGLIADGVIGKETQAAFHVPLAWRVRQIELALERLRWLPDLGDEPLIALNIPMFRLWAWSSTPRGLPSLDMRAIVGRALSTQTPVMVEEMRYLVFRPFWNVPRSILRNEILPILARDLDYLRRHDMEIVRGPGDDAQLVASTAENVALLRSGALRLRQRPGSHNALGLVKFVFPNDADVYMHGTPAQELFSRARRDFSHGCVRLEDPAAMAEWVLRDQPAWDRARILAAMSGSVSRPVNLTRPVRVILYYVTAIVTPTDGAVHFAEDIYRHDARLDRALAAIESLPDIEER